VADTIALGAVVSVAACRGPIIPYSAGQVDATVPGPATVPEPQQPLASHIESFRQHGFNQTEMIALVACGHTFGGVRQADFPLIVTDNTIDVDTFDTTPAFDNTIVSQYLQSTTQNVLVVGPNVTTQSDLWIFSSDENVTMQNLLSPDTFATTCTDLIQRMVNTVPNGVNLTDPIAEPFDYVVSEPFFSYQDSALFMTTSLQVLTPNESSTITMLWADREGSCCPFTGCSVPSSSSREVFFSPLAQLLAPGLTPEIYFFNATINATCSISDFWFEINVNIGSEPLVVDNGGGGFVIEQTSLFVDVLRSEGILLPTFSEVLKVVVAVRGDAASTSASMTVFDPRSTASAPPFTPIITTTVLQLDDSNPLEGGFTFFTANLSAPVTFLDLTANSGGVTYTQENFDFGSVVVTSD
ncbi:heme peroxidase, partial [Gymnopus androsaceus JB14]